MKVLMINVVCGIRSTGRICTKLAEMLERQGHEVKIAYGREDVPNEYQKYAIRIGSNFDVKLHGIKARLFDGCGFGSKKATEQFIAWVKQFDPDVIHLHNIHGYYINIKVLFDYLRTCGKRIIWTLHDCWAFTGHSAYCDAVGCTKWKNGCNNCPELRYYPRSFIDRSKDNWLKKKKIMSDIPNVVLVTPSNWLAGLVKQSFLSNYKTMVIYNGIDTSQFYQVKSDFRESYGLRDKIILLGVATAWSDMKGLMDFIKLSYLLSERYQIVLVGLEKKQIRNLPKNVLGIEKTNSIKELAYIYSGADIYLNLSYCESYGMTNVEAQLCGTPVISYDTGGCVESAQNGVIVKRGNTDSLVHAIETFNLEEKKKLMSIDKKAMDTCTSTDNYLKLYGGY